MLSMDRMAQVRSLHLFLGVDDRGFSLVHREACMPKPKFKTVEEVEARLLELGEQKDSIRSEMLELTQLRDELDKSERLEAAKLPASKGKPPAQVLGLGKK